jgi:hypothetical protein
MAFASENALSCELIRLQALHVPRLICAKERSAVPTIFMGEDFCLGK